MIYPVYVFGSPILRKKAKEIEEGEEGLSELVENLFETMYASDGVGLAAPQVGISKRIFVIDASPMKEDDEALEGFKKAFINPYIIDQTGEKWPFNEGCLSIPTIREDVERPAEVEIEYYDENFNYHHETFSGIKARIIQHEYDHLEGVLFIDKISPLKKKLLKSKLMSISKGKVDVEYKIKFPG